MKPSSFLGLLCLLLLATGCARVTTLTTLNADGSYQRKTTYAVTKMNETAGLGSSEKKGPQKPGDFFKLPVSGNGVQVTQKEDKEATQVIVSRTGATGLSPSQDITLFTDKGEPLATSTVSVSKLADGKLEYTETLHWTGPVTDKPDFSSSETRGVVKRALPEEFQKTDIIDKLTKRIGINIVHAVAGPPEPMLAEIMFNRDAAIKKITILALNSNVASIREVIPSMTETQALDIARKIFDIVNLEKIDQNSQPDPDKKTNSETNAMTPLMFEVKFPGKVVESNGLYDPTTGNVYWSLMAMSVEAEDVKLRVVVQP